MIENCAIYLPSIAVDFETLLPGGRLSGEPARYEYPTEAGPVRLNITYAKDHPEHLQGLRGYVAQLENTDALKKQALALIDDIEMILGVELPAPVAPDSAAFASLTGLFHRLGGFMFVNGSILTSDGFLVGPMTYPPPVMEAIAAVRIDPEIIAAGQAMAPEHMRSLRERTLAAMAQHGFRCSANLPISDDGALRPAEEIARRFAALGMLFLYVDAAEDSVPTEALEKVIARDGLGQALTAQEGAILTQDRSKARAEHQDSIGWKLENMWALAWVFGFEPEPPFHARQLSTDVIIALIEFLPGPAQTVTQFLAANVLRPTADIIEREDRFYCAHNAVRSAQLGSPTVPPDFHPVADGGAIHERRHALTWCLSPGVSWDDTDLST
jgi:hypothetical protein